MRIAIAGASGTGKTTLARAISEKYDLPVNPVGARSVALEMGFQKPYDVDAAGKRVEFQKRLFEAKRAWELEHEAFVTDRTYLDNLTYCSLHMAEHLEEDAIDAFASVMERYDLVFFLPLSVMQELGDGVRKTNLGYHQLYEFLLWRYLDFARTEWDGIQYLATLNMPLDRRLECAFSTIDTLSWRRPMAESVRAALAEAEWDHAEELSAKDEQITRLTEKARQLRGALDSAEAEIRRLEREETEG